MPACRRIAMIEGRAPLPDDVAGAAPTLHDGAMIYRLAYRRYRLSFLRALRTAHGVWREREGLIVRLEDPSGRAGFGEVAPIPGLGSETLAAAEARLAQLGDTAAAAALSRIDERGGCVRFALAAALADVARTVSPLPDEPEAPRTEDHTPSHPSAGTHRLPVAALLPAGREALAAVDRALAEGFVAFKWKVGVFDAADEQAMLDDLLARLPGPARLRLDANGAWTVRLAARWLERCAERPIEFVEQPCFAGAAADATAQRRTNDALLGLANDYPTPIALDESVTGLASLRSWLERGWKSVVVVKPALAGAPEEVLAVLGKHHADAVFSSALETAAGRRAALRTAFAFQGRSPRALGFGVTPLFADGRFDGPPPRPFISRDEVEKMNPEAVWNALS